MPKPRLPNTQTGPLVDHQCGTNDMLVGVNDASAVLYGDAFDMHDKARGGGDELTGGGGLSVIVQNFLYGDAFEMHDHARGGNDQLTGGRGPAAQNTLFGDAHLMSGNTRGGDDALTGAPNTLRNVLFGDAFFMAEDARGGNDTLISGSSFAGVAEALSLFGDASEMHDSTRGGDDMLFGSGRASLLRGDASLMDGDSRGGNDTLTGGNATASSLAGDASEMHDDARGGDDQLTGANAAVSTLFGDAVTMDGNTRGGNDRLISGVGADQMWGDAQFINGTAASPTAPTGSVMTGADAYVFAPGSGNDDIGDFRKSDHDRIDVSAYGFHTLADMILIDIGADTKIAFDATNSVTLLGISDSSVLQASDFIFA